MKRCVTTAVIIKMQLDKRYQFLVFRLLIIVKEGYYSNLAIVLIAM